MLILAANEGVLAAHSTSGAKLRLQVLVVIAGRRQRHRGPPEGRADLDPAKVRAQRLIT